MERETIRNQILENPSTANCEKLIKQLAGKQDSNQLFELFTGFMNDEEEYVRIFAALGLGYLAQEQHCDFEKVFSAIESMADDWSGKVITYGLNTAMFQALQSNPAALLQKFAADDYIKLKPVLFKTFIIAYSKYVVKKNAPGQLEKLLNLITQHITSDNLEVQSGLSTAVNTLGCKFSNEMAIRLEQWVETKNVFAYWVIRDALEKKLGSVIIPQVKTDLLKKMEDNERSRIIQITEAFQLPASQTKVRYEERVVQTILHRVNVWFLPFNWGANPYRGCIHGCEYCYARTSHEYLGNTKEDFERIVYVKVNAADALEKDLTTPRWKKQKSKLVNLGTVTDPYQKIDEKYEITRGLLAKFYEHQNPVTISTKSNLVVRDLDILKKLDKLTNVVFSIPTLDPKLISLIEKGAPPVEKRFEAIEQLKKAGIVVGVTVIPILPYINDNKDEIRRLLKTLAEYKVDYVIPDILNLRGDVRVKMDCFLKTHYPELVEPYRNLYVYGKNKDYADKKYLKDIFDFLMKDCLKEYGLNDYSKMIKGKWQ